MSRLEHIEWVMSRLEMSHVTRWMSHVAQMRVILWVVIMSVRHITYMNASCHAYKWVTSHLWMSHVTPMNESRHTYEWVTSHMWMSHVTPVYESRHTCAFAMSQGFTWIVTRIHMNSIHMDRIQMSCHVTRKNESRVGFIWIVIFLHMDSDVMSQRGIHKTSEYEGQWLFIRRHLNQMSIRCQGFRCHVPRRYA